MSQQISNIKRSGIVGGEGVGRGGGGGKRKLIASSAATLMLLMLLIAIPWTAAAAASTENDQKTNIRNIDSSSSYASGPSNQNDIYIDDDGLEGSGSRGEVREDLEKEDDEASGSGFGDDDEDSASSRSSLSSSSSSSAGSNLNHGQRGGVGGGSISSNSNNDNLPGSGDHDDLYTDTNLPVDPSTTDDEDMPIGKDNSKLSSSSASSPSGGTGGFSNIDDTREPVENDLDLGGLPRHHNTPIEGGSSGVNNHHDNTQYGPGSGVLIMNAKNDDRTASFFAQPGILAAVIGGAVVGLLCAILVVMFIVYRMRKKDEGSYALDEPKRSPTANTYAKNANNREFYA